jgi:FkbH-like protein/FkbM family methyltransferase
MQQLVDFFVDPPLNQPAEILVDIRSFPYLADHGFLDMLVLPGSFYIDMAINLDRQLCNRIPSVVRNVVFQHPVIISEEGSVIKVEVIDHGNNRIEYKFYEAHAENEGALSVGSRYAAKLEVDRNVLQLSKGKKAFPPPPALQSETQAQLDQENFYGRLHENGNNYGRSFQNISSIWQIGSEAFGKLIFCGKDQLSEPHVLHPTILDSVTQLLATFIQEQGKPFVLRSIDRIDILNVNLPNTLFAHATLLRSDFSRKSFVGNVRACDQLGQTYFECNGVALSLLDPTESVEKAKKRFAIASNFTADPLADSLNFWADYFEWPIQQEFAPYNQLFQQLLDTRSELYRKNNDVGVVLLNLEEWIDVDQPDAIAPLNKVDTSRIFLNHPTHTLPNGLLVRHLNQYETEYLYREIFEDHCYLRHGIKLHDGDTVVDIGANIGLFSLFVMSHCRNTKIFAFEPAPITFEILKANCEAYGSNVRTVNAGVSEKSGQAMLTFYENSSVFSGFHADEIEDRKTIRHIVQTIIKKETKLESEDIESYVNEFVTDRLSVKAHKCQMMSVSDIIRENCLQKIDLLKIDAEKSELEIIKGITEDDWPKISQLVIEIHDASGQRVEQIEDLLTRNGFRCVVDQEELLKQSGLYNLYATRCEFKQPDKGTSSLQRNVDDFSVALRSFMNETKRPLVLCFCPADPTTLADPELRTALENAEQQLIAEASAIPNVHSISSALPLEQYSLTDYYDPHSNALGHIPYSNDWYAAVGTMLFRKTSNLFRPPSKVIVLDCDNTLWSGVCAELGPLGVEVDSSHRLLQQFMVDQMNTGKLLCLCSKNNEADVLAVFDQRSDLVLKRDHIVSWRLNWKSKGENIRSLADELNIGLDSFIFIDDNPVECAEVRLQVPEVATLQLPRDTNVIPTFLKHVWTFDSARVTDEDRNRTHMYQETAMRQEFQSQTLSLKEFIRGLQLRTQIAEASDDQLGRVSQLTFRTNQFNFTTIRRQENEIKDLLRREDYACQVVHVADRFGDYGLIGVLIYEKQTDRLKVDTFLLSCRVLGRGVEHQVLAHLGQLALRENKSFIELKCVPTARNEPALQFIDSVGKEFRQAVDWWIFPANYLATLEYEPEEGLHFENDQETGSDLNERRSNLAQQSGRSGLSERFQRITEHLSEIGPLTNAIQQFLLRKQPVTEPDDSRDATSLELAILDIWKSVLGRARINVNDNFFDVGGSSLKAVQVLATIKKQLKRDLSIVSLFEYPSVALLAAKLRANSELVNDRRTTSEAVLRGRKRLARLKARRVH